MFKYTKYLLDKIEGIFKELDYTVRYEKGTFQSGYCIVEHQNVVVINKFHSTESRINCLLEILDKLEYEKESLSENAKKTLKKVNSVLTQGDTSEKANDTTEEASDVTAEETETAEEVNDTSVDVTDTSGESSDIPDEATDTSEEEKETSEKETSEKSE